jgi:hypothetical protein
MRAMLVVVLLELDELPLKIGGGPEQHAVQTFAPHGSNSSFDESMGARHVRHRLDFPEPLSRSTLTRQRGKRLLAKRFVRSTRRDSTRSAFAGWLYQQHQRSTRCSRWYRNVARRWALRQ